MTDDDNTDKDYRTNVAKMGFQLEMIVCFGSFFMNEVLQAAQFCQTEILTTHVYSQVVLASFGQMRLCPKKFRQMSFLDRGSDY